MKIQRFSLFVRQTRHRSVLNANNGGTTGNTSSFTNHDPLPRSRLQIPSNSPPLISPTSPRFRPNYMSSRSLYDSPNSSTPSLPEQQDLEEDLDENPFYTTLKKEYPRVLQRVSHICVPQSRSIFGLKMTRSFIETHSLTPSQYYTGQYVSVNGKVISIERNSVKAVSGFKEPRTIRIMGEELVYNEKYKSVQVLILERPLEGEGKSDAFGMCIPLERNHDADLQFLQSFPNNTQSLTELSHMLAEFNETYIYVRGYEESAVDKISQLFTKASQTILATNSTIRAICRAQHEYEHFQELVENIVMGELHHKIFVQSICPIYVPYDNYLESIIYAYGRARITLRDYGVTERLQDMPEEMLNTACIILASLNEDDGFDINFHPDSVPEEPCQNLMIPAKTPLEKLVCAKRAIQEIANAADTYLNQLAPRHSADDETERSSITTDDFIPLLAYVIVHSRIHRLESVLFYMQVFRLSKVRRSELSFALTTLRASTEFLKHDPLNIHDSASTSSSISSLSSSHSSFKPFSANRYRSRSTSFTTIPAGSSPSTPHHIRCIPMPSSSPQFHHTHAAKREKSPARSISSISSSQNNRPNSQLFQSEHRQSSSDESIQSENNPASFEHNQSQRSRRSSSNLFIKPQILLSPRGRNSIDSDQWSMNNEISSLLTAPTSPISRDNRNPVLLPQNPLISSPPLPEIPLPAKTNKSSAVDQGAFFNRTQNSGQNKHGHRHPPEIIAVIPRVPNPVGAGIGIQLNDEVRTPIIELEPPGPEFMGEFLSSLQEIDGAVSGTRSGGLTRRYV